MATPNLMRDHSPGSYEFHDKYRNALFARVQTPAPSAFFDGDYFPPRSARLVCALVWISRA